MPPDDSNPYPEKAKLIFCRTTQTKTRLRLLNHRSTSVTFENTLLRLKLSCTFNAETQILYVSLKSAFLKLKTFGAEIRISEGSWALEFGPFFSRRPKIDTFA